jgi:hypothetical protein
MLHCVTGLVTPAYIETSEINEDIEGGLRHGVSASLQKFFLRGKKFSLLRCG